MLLDGLILCLLAAVLATPLVFLQAATQDDLPKVVFLLWGTVALWTLVLLRNLSLRRWAFTATPLLLAVVLFACVRAAGAAFAPSLDETLADLALLTGCVALAVLVLVDRPIAEWMEHNGLAFLVLVGGVVAALGVLQTLGVDPVRGIAAGQAVSTLGNPNFAGGLACALLPLALALALAPGDRPIRIAMLVCAGVLLAEGVLSRSRGAWLGGAAGLCLFGGFFLFGRLPGDVRPLRRLAAAAAAGFLLVSLGVGAATRVGEQFLATLANKSPDREVRPSLWSGSVRMFQDAPWTGHGTGGFGAAYVAYREESEARLSGNASRVEDPHCEPLRLAAENGVPGLVAGALLLLAAAAAARHALARGTGLRPYLLAVGIVSSLTALFVSGLVNPLGAVPALALLGWVLVSTLGSLRTVPRGETRVYRPTRSGLLLCALPGLAGLVAISLFATGLLRNDLRRREAGDSGDPAQVERLLRQSAPSDPSARFLLAQLYSATGDHLRGAAQARAAVAERPWDGHSWTQLGACEGRAGRLDEAERAYLEAVRLEPGYAQARAGLAEVYRLTGRLDQAEEQRRRLEEIQKQAGGTPQ